MAISRHMTNREGVVHLLVGLLFLTALFGLTNNSAHAHAAFLESNPADGTVLTESPSQIELTFTEPVGIVDGGTSLHSAAADPISLAPVASGSTITVPIEAPLADGSYVLQWRVISADSHPISGTVSFSVGVASLGGEIAVDTDLPAWVEWGNTLAMLAGYGGMLASFGLLTVGWLLVRSDMAHVANLVRKTAMIGAMGLVAQFPFAAIIQRGSIPDSLDAWIASLRDIDTNTLWALGAGFGLLIAVLLASRGNLRDRDLFLIVSVISFTSLMTLLVSGHTRTKSPIWLMLISDAVHVAAGAIWIGGILILTLGLSGRWKGESFSSPSNSIRVVAGFSRLAIYTAAALVISGVTMAVIILDSWDALLNTDYGTNLMIKTGLVVATLAMAAVNRFVLLRGSNRERESNIGWLRRLVTIELVLLLIVVGATGSLVQRNPNVAESAPEQTVPSVLYEGEQPLDGSHSVRLTVKNSFANTVTVDATIIDANRNIVIPDADLELNWSLPDQGLGPLPQVLSIDAGTGAYSGEFVLPMRGEWSLEIQIRIDRFTDSRTTVTVTLPD